MTGRPDEMKLVADTIAGIDEIRQSRLRDRAYRIVEHGDASGGAIVFRVAASLRLDVGRPDDRPPLCNLCLL